MPRPPDGWISAEVSNLPLGDVEHPADHLWLERTFGRGRRAPKYPLGVDPEAIFEHFVGTVDNQIPWHPGDKLSDSLAPNMVPTVEIVQHSVRVKKLGNGVAIGAEQRVEV